MQTSAHCRRPLLREYSGSTVGPLTPVSEKSYRQGGSARITLNEPAGSSRGTKALDSRGLGAARSLSALSKPQITGGRKWPPLSRPFFDRNKLWIGGSDLSYLYDFGLRKPNGLRYLAEVRITLFRAAILTA